MKSNVAAQRADEDDLEAAMSPAELAALKAAIARADEQYARGVRHACFGAPRRLRSDPCGRMIPFRVEIIPAARE
jgi:hypothetical protein